MAIPKEHYPVQFFVGVLTADEKLWEIAKKSLCEKWGEIEMMSEKTDFDKFTDYYRSEMGENLVRFWVALADLYPPEDLIRLKWDCTEIENSLAQNGNRRINLDPGYISEAKVILASFKDFSHRIYLGDCVYADMQLMWRGKKFVPMEWTFADYKSLVAQDFLKKLRQSYREKLKAYSKS